MPTGHTDQLVGTGQFIADAAAGTLPDFSFVRPGYGYSEEPPEDTSLGDSWLGQLVLALMNGPDWSSTAIFVTYDEGGGFWDHVSPPQVDPSGYGTRTPMVVISPYTRPQLISQTTTNLSVLSFMQALWHLPALGTANAHAAKPDGPLRFRSAPEGSAIAPGGATRHFQDYGDRARLGLLHRRLGPGVQSRSHGRNAGAKPGSGHDRRGHPVGRRPGRSARRQTAGGCGPARGLRLVQCPAAH